MAPFYFSKNVNGYVTGKRFSVDRPAVTVMAHGMGGDHWRSWLVANDERGDVMPEPETKPPYRVPLMKEIEAIPSNGLTVASFFAGAGGSSTGYRMAGFKVLYANEFVPIAQESYRANAAPYTVVDGRDVKIVTAADVLKACKLKAGELDVLDGSPPCQAFSTAGRREKGWGTERHYEHGADQKNEELFSEFIRLRDGIKPRVFVAENVSGLVKGKAKGFFLEILAELRRGYDVVCPLLDAQWLGVPQSRQRIVFIGVRKDLGLPPPTIQPLPHRYSVRDALPWITRADHDTQGLFSSGDMTNRPSPAILASPRDARHYQVHGVEVRKLQNGDTVDENVAASLEGYAIGKEWDKLNPGQQSEKFFSLVPDADQPCPTITASAVGSGKAGGPGNTASVTHPFEKRKFTILEVKRLCSFPDDFALKGTYGQQWERLGNSVPPLMMRAVAIALRDEVLLPARAVGKGKSKQRARGKDRAASRGASGKAPSRAGRSPSPRTPEPIGST